MIVSFISSIHFNKFNKFNISFCFSKMEQTTARNPYWLMWFYILIKSICMRFIMSIFFKEKMINTMIISRFPVNNTLQIVRILFGDFFRWFNFVRSFWDLLMTAMMTTQCELKLYWVSWLNKSIWNKTMWNKQ